METAPIERTLEHARHALGEAAFAGAWDMGRALPIERLLAEGLATAHAMPASAAAGADLDRAAVRGHLTHVVAIGFDLTRREREVLALLCKRLTDIEIAGYLFISPRTASTHVGRVIDKLGASNRRDAAAIAARHGWV